MRLIIGLALIGLAFMEVLAVVALPIPRLKALGAGLVAWLFIIQVIWGWVSYCDMRRISHIDDGTY